MPSMHPMGWFDADLLPMAVIIASIVSFVLGAVFTMAVSWYFSAEKCFARDAKKAIRKYHAH